MAWLGEVLVAVLQGAFLVFKGIFGLDKPQRDTVKHAKRDVEVEGGSDREKLKDLGL